MNDCDEHFMRRALELAKNGWGRTNPNPLVGAVIVKDNIIVAEGWHAFLGGPHAEVAALADAKEKNVDVRGATMYVTLEPCSHYGRTPPCSLAIIQAGLGRVVTAMQDPNPLVAGRGLEQLKNKGIEVTVGILENEARVQNEIFLHYITKRRPFVHYKAACSLDGKTASSSGLSQWISGLQSRELVHKWRSRYAAVMVGIGTALSDDPQLTARDPDGQALDRQPLRIVLDAHLRLPPKSNLAQTAKKWPVLVVCSSEAPMENRKSLEALGVRLLEAPTHGGQFDLGKILEDLGRLDIDSILLEGGAETAAHFMEKNLIDKFSFFQAPFLMGGKTAPGLLGGSGLTSPHEGLRLERISTRCIGDDILLEAYPNRAQGAV